MLTRDNNWYFDTSNDARLKAGIATSQTFLRTIDNIQPAQESTTLFLYFLHFHCLPETDARNFNFTQSLTGWGS